MKPTSILKQAAIDLAITIVIAVAIAVLLHAQHLSWKWLRVGLTFSLLIGIFAWAAIDIPRLMLWGNQRPAPWFWGWVVAASLLCWMLGSSIAASIWQVPWTLETNYRADLLVVLLASGVVISVLWLRSSAAQHAEALAVSRAQEASGAQARAEAEVKLLSAQLAPHFISNTLANLRAMISTDPNRAQRYVEELEGYFRSATHALSSARITLAEECALIEHYLQLMAVRLGERLTWRIQLAPALREVTIPPLLLQPLVENAIRHGIEPSATGGVIELSVAATEGIITVTVRNTGVALQTRAAHTGGSGIGLDLVKRRLAQAFGPRAELILKSHAQKGSSGDAATVAQLIWPYNS